MFLNLNSCVSIDEYTDIKQVSTGNYGTIYTAILHTKGCKCDIKEKSNKAQNGKMEYKSIEGAYEAESANTETGVRRCSTFEEGAENITAHDASHNLQETGVLCEDSPCFQVVLKKFKKELIFDTDGFSRLFLREINILKSIKHKNIINLINVTVGKNIKEIYLALEKMQIDLKTYLYNLTERTNLDKDERFLENLCSGIIKDPRRINEKILSDRKSIGIDKDIHPILILLLSRSIFSAITHLHSLSILHRDLKPSNFLLSHSGLKLSDFGLSRSQAPTMSNLVVTLWYRPPEILLGSTTYTEKIDIWSAASILYEIINNKVLYKGKTEIEQIQIIFKHKGIPKEELDEIDVPHLKKFKTIKNTHSLTNENNHSLTHNTLDTKKYIYPLDNVYLKKYPKHKEYLNSILNNTLIYNPSKRLSSKEILEIINKQIEEITNE